MKKIVIPFVTLAIATLFWCCGNQSNNQSDSQSASTDSVEKQEVVAINPSEYQTSNTENMEEVCKFLKDCGYYFLATQDGNQPRVRPFGTANIFEGKLYIQSGKVKNVAKQIAANPRVEICACNGPQWLRIETTLVADERREAKVSMLDAHPSLKGMYSADDDNTMVWFMTNSKATFSSFTAEDRVVEF